MDINIFSPNNLYRGIYIARYNGICIRGIKYVLNEKYGINEYIELE